LVAAAPPKSKIPPPESVTSETRRATAVLEVVTSKTFMYNKATFERPARTKKQINRPDNKANCGEEDEPRLRRSHPVVVRKAPWHYKLNSARTTNSFKIVLGGKGSDSLSIGVHSWIASAVAGIAKQLRDVPASHLQSGGDASI